MEVGAAQLRHEQPRLLGIRPGEQYAPCPANVGGIFEALPDRHTLAVTGIERDRADADDVPADALLIVAEEGQNAPDHRKVGRSYQEPLHSHLALERRRLDREPHRDIEQQQRCGRPHRATPSPPQRRTEHPEHQQREERARRTVVQIEQQGKDDEVEDVGDDPPLGSRESMRPLQPRDGERIARVSRQGHVDRQIRIGGINPGCEQRDDRQDHASRTD